MKNIFLNKKEVDNDIYEEEMRELLLDSDEVSDWEEAFMRGYEEAG